MSRSVAASKPRSLKCLVTKRDRTIEEDHRLAEVDARLSELPMEEDPSDSKAMDIIRRAAKLFEEDAAAQ